MGMLNRRDKLEVQAVVDERDLNRVVVLSYVFAGFYTLAALLVLGNGVAALFGMPLLAGLGATVSSVFFLALTFLSAGCMLLLAYANVLSAKAIKAREDEHLSLYVAGINTATSFPLGTLVGWYSWRVLSRSSVRDLYQAPLRGAPSLESKQPKSKGKVRLVTAPEEPAVEPMQFHEAIKHADDKEEAMWKEIEEEHKRRGSDEPSDL